jgi:hypothetical protein
LRRDVIALGPNPDGLYQWQRGGKFYHKLFTLGSLYNIYIGNADEEQMAQMHPWMTYAWDEGTDPATGYPALIGKHLQGGGLVLGPTLAMIGEGGRKEGVLPLEDPRAMKEIADAINAGGGRFGSVTIIIQDSPNPNATAKAVWRELLAHGGRA